MAPGKLLFERLEKTDGWTLEGSIKRSLQQLATNQYVRDSAMEPGVLNFGLPSLPDLGVGGGDMKTFAALLKTRIQQFEPRLKNADVLIEQGRLVVVGQLQDQDETIRWWV